jgi:UDP-glucose 4-epimerase
MDASVNVDGILNLLEAVLSAGRGRVLFASSGGAIYGDCRKRPTPETAAKRPESPYGVAKLTGEQYLYCFHRLHGLDYVALRYANVYGPGQDPRGEAGVAAIFSDRLLQGRALEVYGDGEQTRDYVYVDDVVSANLLMSDAELPRAPSLDARAWNVGTGEETSVNRLAQAFMDAAGRPVDVQHTAARAGEVRRSCLRTDKLWKAGWRARMPFDEGVASTLASLREEAEGRGASERDSGQKPRHRPRAPAGAT